ncbi:ABC transporter ATP-binding protein [Embleya sp. NBC_00888]|uniref:ABC transporter ATP-binding protein n=1 Tax=Embleya sp. NBC_00888 TaxID=2975960 RepID=UPI00386CFA57|nr:ABC transporter ATP-binding protein [Embleya sp. NBC_00888]
MPESQALRRPGPTAQAPPELRPAVVFHALVKRYRGDVGVRGVDLEIAGRQVFALVGPNGAGKTTLLNLLCDLIEPDAGTVTVTGRPALCPDAAEFEPWLTGSEVVRQSFALARPGERLDPGRYDEVVDGTGVRAFARRRCGGYSRGMTQRLGIAAALILDPDVLVLDEPTSALDPVARADMLSLIRRLGTRRTVVLSSHTLADVQRVADTIAVMDAGRLLFTGPPRVLIDEHLRPAWRVTLTHDAGPVVGVLSGHAAVRDVRRRGVDEFDIEFRTVAKGAELLVGLLAEVGARVSSLVPVDADLESAFLALTGRDRRREDER